MGPRHALGKDEMTAEDSIENLDWVIGALDNRRRKALGIAQEYGELYDDLSTMHDMWKQDPDSMRPILSSGSTPLAIAEARRELESSPSPETWAPSLENLKRTITFSTTSTASVYVTTTTLRQPEDPDSEIHQPSKNPAYLKLRDRIRRRARRPDVERLLDEIDPSIADMYRTAWQTWPLPTSDPTRGPLFLTREVLTQTVNTLSEAARAPEIKERRKKVEWITNNLSKRGVNRELLQVATGDALKAYKNLCRAHSLGRLRKEEAEVWMYQAGDYLGLLLNGIDLAKWKALKGQLRKS